MVIITDIPGAAVLGQGHICNPFALEESSEALNLASLVTEDQDLGEFSIEVGTDGVFCPDFSDPAFDNCISVPTRPVLIFCLHSRRKAMQVGGGKPSQGGMIDIEVGGE